MPNLKQLRERIKSIQATAKLTKAMKMVAASKLTKAKKDCASSSAYSNTARDMLNKLNLSDLKESEDIDLEVIHKYFDKPTSDNVLIILFGAEKGLSGNFNAILTKKLKLDLNDFIKNNKKVELVIVGNRSYNLLNHDLSDHIIDMISTLQYNYAQVTKKLVTIIENKIQHGAIECYIYFNLFKNSMIYIPTQKLLLPILNKENNTSSDYEFEGADLLTKVIRLYLESTIHNALVNSKASEEGARVTAMDNATNNANDLVDGLTMRLNKTRQANITQELTELISGAEAV